MGLLGPVGAGSAAGSRKRPIEVTTSKEDSMKIVRYGQPHQEKPGILDSDGNIHDLSGIVPEIAGQTLSPVTLASLKSIEGGIRLKWRAHRWCESCAGSAEDILRVTDNNSSSIGAG